MKKLVFLVIVVLLVSMNIVGCNSEASAPTESNAKATDNITDEPTSVPTEITTEKMSVKARLKQGYWIEKEGDNGIMVFTFDGEKLYNDYYENQKGVYVKIDGPGYSNFCIPNFTKIHS